MATKQLEKNSARKTRQDEHAFFSGLLPVFARAFRREGTTHSSGSDRLKEQDSKDTLLIYSEHLALSLLTST